MLVIVQIFESLFKKVRVLDEKHIGATVLGVFLVKETKNLPEKLITFISKSSPRVPTRFLFEASGEHVFSTS